MAMGGKRLWDHWLRCWFFRVSPLRLSWHTEWHTGLRRLVGFTRPGSGGAARFPTVDPVLGSNFQANLVIAPASQARQEGGFVHGIR